MPRSYAFGRMCADLLLMMGALGAVLYLVLVAITCKSELRPPTRDELVEAAACIGSVLSLGLIREAAHALFDLVAKPNAKDFDEEKQPHNQPQ